MANKFSYYFRLRIITRDFNRNHLRRRSLHPREEFHDCSRKSSSVCPEGAGVTQFFGILKFPNVGSFFLTTNPPRRIRVRDCSPEQHVQKCPPELQKIQTLLVNVWGVSKPPHYEITTNLKSIPKSPKQFSSTKPTGALQSISHGNYLSYLPQDDLNTLDCQLAAAKHISTIKHHSCATSGSNCKWCRHKPATR